MSPVFSGLPKLTKFRAFLVIPDKSETPPIRGLRAFVVTYRRLFI